MIQLGKQTEEIIPEKKGRIVVDIKSKDIYKHFKKNNKYLALDINETLFNQILDNYNKLLTHDILEGKIMKIFPNLGHIGIIECERSLTKETKDGKTIARLEVDWGKTRKLNLLDENGKFIRQYFENQKYYYKLKWFKYSTIPNVNLTKFHPAKDFRRTIPKKLADNLNINLTYRNNNDIKKRVFDTPLIKFENTKV